jgi:hypothetical protein
MTVNSPALPQSQPPVDKEKSESVLSASQVKQINGPERRKSVSGGNPSCGVRLCSARGVLHYSSVFGCANLACRT